MWPRLGNVANYVEPFAGSLAVLLSRPSDPRVETVNDKDAYLANFWRALQAAPEEVAKHCDWPVNEADLHARHKWLVNKGRKRLDAILENPHFYDAKIAGWWVWGQCLWIGSGWCVSPEWTGRANAGRRERGINARSTRNGDTTQQQRRPQLTGDQGVIIEPPKKRFVGPGNGQGAGVHKVSIAQKKPQFDRGGRGVAGLEAQGLTEQSPWKKRPAANRSGESNGIHRVSLHRWQGGGQGGGSGVHAPSMWKQLPDLSGSRGAVGRGCASARLVKTEGLYRYLEDLSVRLRRVRVCVGEWNRVLTPSVTTYIGTTGVLLDPPYKQSERSICYGEEPTHELSAEVREWAIKNGENPKFRIALCGYEGEHEMPDTWECVPWKAHGGYSRSARGVANRSRERIWFSPHCLSAELPLFTDRLPAKEMAS